MIDFIVGALMSLIWMALGFAAGWRIRGMMSAEALEDVHRRLMRPSKESGSVRPYTKAERERAADKSVQRAEDVIQGLGGDQ